MGDRVYIPKLGRFLSVDPVEGGTLNNYVYALDPINQYDLNGRFIPAIVWAAVAFLLVSAPKIHSAVSAIVAAFGGGAPKSAAVSTGATAVKSVSSGYKSSLSVGRAAHREFTLHVESSGGIANKAVFNGVRARPDGYMPRSNTILELKPANSRGVRDGMVQLQGYQKLAPQGSQIELWLYQEFNGKFHYHQYLQGGN